MAKKRVNTAIPINDNFKELNENFDDLYLNKIDRPTGVPNGTKFLRDDGTWANPINMIEEIQRTGQYSGKAANVYVINGRRAGFTNTSSPHDLKEFDSTSLFFTQMTGSESLEIVSTSEDDSSSGIGVRSVKVTYINNSNSIVQSSTITLNGTTPVSLPFTANEILWMESASSGSARIAQGNIKIRIVSGVELEQITANSSKSKTGKFMIPAGFTGYVVRWNGQSINNDQDLFILAQCETLSREFSQAYHFMDNLYIAVNNASPDKELGFLKVPELARIKLSTVSAGTAGTVRSSGSFTVVIIQN